MPPSCTGFAVFFTGWFFFSLLSIGKRFHCISAETVTRTVLSVPFGTADAGFFTAEWSSTEIVSPMATVQKRSQPRFIYNCERKIP